MSLWYRTGTINLTNGSTTLTGVGTAWVANVSPGMMVVYDRQIIGEVQSVNSNTSITLAVAYAGSTITGGAYAIANLGAVRDGLIAAVNDALAAFQAEQGGPLSGRFGDGTLAEPGLAFLADLNTGFRRPAADQIGMVTGGVQRALLSSAALNLSVPITGSAVQSGTTDATAGRLMTVGAFGLGGLAPTFVGDLDRTDNTIAPGWYAVNAASFTGTLPTTNGFYILNHRRRNTNGGEVQMAIREGTGVCYIRWRSTGAWSAWAEQLDGSRLQTTATDTGVTKLLGVGGFGVGSTTSTPDVLDLDNYTTPQGFYRVNATTVLGTKPASGTVTDSLVVLRPNGNQIHQIYSVTNNGATYIRKSIGTTSWGPWNELYTSGNILGTVSQSGGVPTGAVIERGSNANGRYVRFADGAQICTHTLTSDGAVDTVWTYPAAFVGVDGLAIAPAIGAARMANAATSGIGNTTLTFNVWTVAPSRVSELTRLTAIGRWF